jgi:hypothetical protein
MLLRVLGWFLDLGLSFLLLGPARSSLLLGSDLSYR